MRQRSAHTAMSSPSSGGTILKINVLLLYATGLGTAAYWIWPSMPRDWGWGFTSLLLTMAALATLVDAIKAAVQLVQQERAIARYLAQGNKPKTAEMASLEALKRAGMIDERE